MTIPTAAPASFRQGLTVRWTIDPGDDYRPEDGWSCSYDFARSSDTQTVTATDNGDGTFLVSIAATQSDDFDVGRYNYAATVTDGTDVYEIDRGTIEVLPALDSAVDARSHVRTVLDLVEAAIESAAANNSLVVSYTITTGGGSRSVQTIPLADAYVLRDKLLREVKAEERAERIAKGLGTKSKVRVRFV